MLRPSPAHFAPWRRPYTACSRAGRSAPCVPKQSKGMYMQLAGAHLLIVGAEVCPNEELVPREQVFEGLEGV